MAKNKKNKRGPIIMAGLFVLGLIVGALISVYVLRQDLKPSTTPSVYKEAPKVVPPPVVTPVVKYSGPVVVFVIDDMGQTMRGVDTLLSLPVPVTFAIIPHLKYSKKASEMARAKGLEVILHLPMEPKDLKGNNPGEGALLTSMDQDALIESINSSIESVPGIIGVNNHMGSRFTEDYEGMLVVLGALKERELFFLDSLTTGRSVGRKVSAELDMRFARRDVFLDNERNKEYIIAQVSELLTRAKKHGSAIGIGHQYPETIEALAEIAPLIEGQGVTVVKLSELVQ